MGSGSSPADVGVEHDVYRTVHDWAVDGEVSTTVVQAVATATNTAPASLPSLYDAVDPDALDALVRGFYDRGTGSVRFDVAGCSVTVDARGTVEVSPPG